MTLEMDVEMNVLESAEAPSEDEMNAYVLEDTEEIKRLERGVLTRLSMVPPGIIISYNI